MEACVRDHVSLAYEEIASSDREDKEQSRSAKIFLKSHVVGFRYREHYWKLISFPQSGAVQVTSREDSRSSQWSSFTNRMAQTNREPS